MRFFQKTPAQQRNQTRPVHHNSDAVNLSKPMIDSGLAPIDAGIVFATEKPIQSIPSNPSVGEAGKTRLIGFDTSDGRLDLFDDDAKAKSADSFFMPVGWLMVTEGPGRGHCFPLQAGMSTIGRADDQTVRLDFGDRAISRSNHAAIVYDPKTHEFLLGHGGKANLVRLNGKPIVSTEPITDGATIQIGETAMRFVALCDEAFNWNEEESAEDDEDVAYL